MMMRRITLGLFALSLAGCTSLSPSQINNAASLLKQFGLSLKTVNAETGEEETLDKNDVSSVTDEDGNKIDYNFEDSGKMVFRPKKSGKQTVTVNLSDGSSREFEVEGQEGNDRVEGEVGFVPDASGQSVTSEVAIGGKVDPIKKQQEQLQQFAGKRIRVTFGGQGLPGAPLPGSLKALILDKTEFPIFSAQIVEGGKLDVEPQVFFFVRDFKGQKGVYPDVTVAFNYQNKVRIVKATLSSLPELPAGQPDTTKPDQFSSGQTLDLTLQGTPEDTLDLGAYLRNNKIVKVAPPGPQGGQQPPGGQTPGGPQPPRNS